MPSRQPSRASAAPAQPCSSPLTYNVGTTNNGEHQFGVEAIDAAGNVSQATFYTWKVAEAAVPVTIRGNTTGLVYPGGVTRPFATTFNNPNSNPVTITSLTTTLGTVPGQLPGKLVHDHPV